MKNEKSGLVQAVFYQAGELAISETLKISVDSQAAIILKISKGVVTEITASDPSRMLGKLHLEIEDGAGKHERAIELPGGFFAGQSVIIIF